MRASYRLALKYLFLTAGLNMAAQTYAQLNCNCPEYYTLYSNQDKSIGSNTAAQEKLQASSFSICRAKGFEWIANDYLEKGSFDTAEIFLQKAENTFRESKCSDSVLLTTYKLWAQLYYTRGEFAKSQEYSFKLLQSAEASGSPHEQGVCYTMIAQLFNQTGQAEKGIVYSRKAVAFLDAIDNPVKKADLLFKLSKRYLWHYQDTKTARSLDSSELFSLQQLAIARSINRHSSIAAAFNNLQGIAYEKQDYRKALEFLDSSFAYSDNNNPATLATNYYDKADLLIEIKNYKEAERMADSALAIYQRSQSVAYIGETYELLSRIALAKGDFKKAFEKRELNRAITDSIKNLEKVSLVTELERKYSQAKNEKTIKELAQQKQIYLLFAIAALLAALAVGFFLRQQSLKHKQKIMETEQRLNRSRMNPHFFFNTLASLQSFALQGNDGKSIASSISKFSHIMRETLESTYKEYVTIAQEIEFLEEYLSLQQVRFPTKFTYRLLADDDLDPDDILIPSMIIQPFVENSIEHGFAGIEYPGQIEVKFKKEKKELLVEVLDNGIGLNYPEKSLNVHISRASQIIKDRIYLLNIKLKTKAGFTIDNNKEGRGVLVHIHLPLISKRTLSSQI